MKHLILFLLFLVCSLSAMEDVKGLKARLSKIKKEADRMMVQQAVPAAEAPVVAPVPAAPAPVVRASRSRAESGHTTYGERVARLEERVDNVKENISKLQSNVGDLEDVLTSAVAAMEAQTKVMADNKSSGDRSELIINIVLGIVGMIMTGGTGYFAWKKKGLVFRKRPDLSGTSDGNK